MLTTILRTGLVIVIAASAATAHAEDKAAARQAYIAGSKYYDLGQYGEALEAFKRAYWNYEEPSFLFNIAQCHRALGHKTEAIDSYRSYLRKSPDARNRQDVERVIADLQSALEKEKAVANPSPQAPAAIKTETARQPSTAPLETSTARTKPTPSRMEHPAWKRPWVWGLVGGVVVAGVAVGLGVGLGMQAHPPKADGSVAF